MASNLDHVYSSTEHAEQVHPIRELFRHHFYLDNFVNREGGMWLVLLNALLFVPLVMAAFFYPAEVLLVVALVLGVAFVGYEGYVLWRKRHARA